MAIIYINSAEMPSPSDMRVDVEGVGEYSKRAASGALVVDRICEKRVISLSWNHITDTSLSALFTAMGSGSFSVTYPDPVTGASRTASFYCVSKSARSVRTGAGRAWSDVSMKWEEA